MGIKIQCIKQLKVTGLVGKWMGITLDSAPYSLTRDAVQLMIHVNVPLLIKISHNDSHLWPLLQNLESKGRSGVHRISVSLVPSSSERNLSQSGKFRNQTITPTDDDA